MTTMTQSSIPILQKGMPYYGYVVSVENAYHELKARSEGDSITYCHRLIIRFDISPDNEIECQFCTSDKASRLFTSGEYVKVFIKNHHRGNYTVRKDETYVDPASVLNAALPERSASTESTSIPAIVHGDIKASFIQSAVMAAATYTQYRPDILKGEFYSIIEELYNMMAMRYEKD